MILNNLSLLLGDSSLVGLIEIVIMVFSLMLMSLSITAYKRTSMKKLLFAAIAFALFAFQLLLEYLDGMLNILSDEQIDLVEAGIVLFTLILFFLAIVRKK